MVILCCVQNKIVHIYLLFNFCVGVLNKTSAYESTRAVYSVKAIYRLSVISTNRDVSIIELNEEISFTEHVRPICLPMKSHDSHPTPGIDHS